MRAALVLAILLFSTNSFASECEIAFKKGDDLAFEALETHKKNYQSYYDFASTKVAAETTGDQIEEILRLGKRARTGILATYEEMAAARMYFVSDEYRASCREDVDPRLVYLGAQITGRLYEEKEKVRKYSLNFRIRIQEILSHQIANKVSADVLDRTLDAFSAADRARFPLTAKDKVVEEFSIDFFELLYERVPLSMAFFVEDIDVSLVKKYLPEFQINREYRETRMATIFLVILRRKTPSENQGKMIDLILRSGSTDLSFVSSVDYNGSMRRFKYIDLAYSVFRSVGHEAPKKEIAKIIKIVSERGEQPEAFTREQIAAAIDIL